ncbi:MAG: terminase [Porticoccaceae bacterium]|jgi:hypothetical protein|nr:terminase [Porticoccaceae bacterium]|tara:strand:+ start:11551 stop:13407 length:1857 start_codon:yes stop_codon:yes gene_type:complete
MSDYQVVLKKEYDSNLHKDWKTFGEVLVKTKKDLLGWLAEQRTYKDAPTEETHPELFVRNPTNVSHYLGNPNVKAPHSNLEYTPEQLREYKKCMEDPIYFSETYVKIMSVDFGAIPFTLYGFQKKMVDSFKDNRFSICKLPRQCGKSTTSVAFILWYVLFNQGKNVGILANKGELAQELLGRLQLAYESLPFWLQQGVETYNKRSISLENGSRIVATSSSGSAARGMSFSLLFLDEFAFVPPHDAEDFFRSVYPTISSGSDTKMIVVSTPKGMNHFYKMWMEAQEQRSAFKPIEINWWDVPGRDDNWKQQQIANTSEDQFRQEFETQFIGSASTLISPSKLANMSFINPIRKKDEVDFYEEPKEDHRYLITVDCARGLRLDYSAFVVFDVTTIPYKVVAKYRSNTVTPMIYPQFLANIGTFFNNAHILVETNDVGGQVVGALHDDFEYENLLKTVTKGRAGFVLGEGQSSKLGVTTSASVKTKGCSNFKSLIETDKLLTTDYDIYVEMTTFTRKNDNVNSSFAAEPGTNDDLVMCMVLFGWCVGSDYWKEMTETNPSDEIYKDKLNEQEDDMPLGFQSFATMNERIMDNTGDLWVVVDENREPELPSWYEDVYKTVNL